MEASETPTIDALLSEVQTLAQHAAAALRENPQVHEIVGQIEAVRVAIEAARAEAPPAEPAPEA
jgi:hypothetical protein